MAFSAAPIPLLVLNYNGRRWLAECLPSVLRAAAHSRHACQVIVVDNSSRDDSIQLLANRFPEVQVIRCANRGLSSFNDVLAALPGHAAILLNNDIKLAADAVDPLVAPLLDDPRDGSPARFMAAPLCWQFDGVTYEGFRTGIGWRWGLVQATARFPGNEQTRMQEGWTASAGAAIAVHRRRFLELGGFDPLYLPGRLEDLDFAFRGYMAGYAAQYVPQSVAWHWGQASFQEVFGAEGCELLALRNTLLFQWKNLRHPSHLLRQASGIPLRLAFDLLRAAWQPLERRLAFWRAFCGAVARVGSLRRSPYRAAASWRNESAYFRRFKFASMASRKPLPDSAALATVCSPQPGRRSCMRGLA